MENIDYTERIEQICTSVLGISSSSLSKETKKELDVLMRSIGRLCKKFSYTNLRKFVAAAIYLENKKGDTVYDGK